MILLPGEPSSAPPPPASPSRRLRPLPCLRTGGAFERVYGEGQKRVRPLLVAHLLNRGDTEPIRLGLTVSRRCGGAVVRNRIRRRLREIFRQESPSLSAGWDIVLTARPAASDAPFHELRRQALECVARIRSRGSHV